MTMRIVDRDPTNIACRIQGKNVRIDVVAQAATQAWTEYETFTVHQVQAYAGEGNTSSAEAPHNVSVPGGQAAWVPALHELVATNGTQSRGGSYVTVTLNGPGASGGRAVALSRGVAAAVLSVAPRGSNPAAPTS
jgi:hypothetical protein